MTSSPLRETAEHPFQFGFAGESFSLSNLPRTFTVLRIVYADPSWGSSFRQRRFLHTRLFFHPGLGLPPPTAFYAITSLMTVALNQCCIFSIGSILWRRIYMPETIPKSSFSLEKWGRPINAVGFLWCMWTFVNPALSTDLLDIVHSLFLTMRL